MVVGGGGGAGEGITTTTTTVTTITTTTHANHHHHHHRHQPPDDCILLVVILVLLLRLLLLLPPFSSSQLVGLSSAFEIVVDSSSLGILRDVAQSTTSQTCVRCNRLAHAAAHHRASHTQWPRQPRCGCTAARDLKCPRETVHVPHPARVRFYPLCQFMFRIPQDNNTRCTDSTCRNPPFIFHMVFAGRISVPQRTSRKT